MELEHLFRSQIIPIYVLRIPCLLEVSDQFSIVEEQPFNIRLVDYQIRGQNLTTNRWDLVATSQQ